MAKKQTFAKIKEQFFQQRTGTQTFKERANSLPTRNTCCQSHRPVVSGKYVNIDRVWLKKGTYVYDYIALFHYYSTLSPETRWIHMFTFQLMEYFSFNSVLDKQS